MRFFLEIHRSIADSKFYEEAAKYSGARVFAYLLTLWLVTSLVLTAAQYRLVIDKEEGLPAVMSSAFPDMKITAGKMSYPGALPHIVPNAKVSDLASVLSYSSPEDNTLPDSLIVLDSIMPDSLKAVRNSVRLILGPEKMRLFVEGHPLAELTYKTILAEGEQIVFTPSGIREFLDLNAYGLIFNIFIQRAVMFGFSMLASVFLLAIISYINRTELTRSLTVCAKWGAYAFTPVAIGTMIVAIAGVRIGWLWQVAIMISLFLLFRASTRLQLIERQKQGGQNQ